MLFRIADKRKFAIEICASLLILLFIYAAASKLMDFDRYVGEIHNQPFNNRWTPVLVVVIPAAEILVAILLSFDRTRKWGLMASIVLMSVFSGYILLIMFKVYDRVPCTCGGVISDLTWPQHLVFNLFFLAVAITGYLLNKRAGKHPTGFSMRPPMGATPT